MYSLRSKMIVWFLFYVCFQRGRFFLCIRQEHGPNCYQNLKNCIAIAIAIQVSQSHRNRKVRNRNRKYKNRKINLEIAIAINQRCDAIGTPGYYTYIYSLLQNFQIFTLFLWDLSGFQVWHVELFCYLLQFYVISIEVHQRTS